MVWEKETSLFAILKAKKPDALTVSLCCVSRVRTCGGGVTKSTREKGEGKKFKPFVPKNLLLRKG